MIRKLRRKFVIINMLLVTIVLVAVLSILCLSNLRRYESDSHEALTGILNMPSDLPPEPGLENRKGNRPRELMTVFLVLLDEEDNMVSLIQNSSAQVDEDFAADALAAALASGQEEGRLPSLELRFLKGEHTGYRAIAFTDTTHETSSMRNLILTSFLILFGALAAFFLISLFLSRLALRPVEQAWQQQNQFIADASHELKTPLTVILANLNILLSHREDTIARQARWIESTQAEASRMKELVEQLLFLAKSESHTLSTQKTPLNFSDLAWTCLLPMESLAFEQGVLIQEQISPDLTVLGNEGQLRQLFIILLDNALKYAEKEKQVTVLVSPAQDKLLFSVKNTGTPIPKEDLPHLFERFYRSDKSRVRKKGGYGLGLSIAQTIVQHHSGKITVESSEQAGTTFRVTLPLYTADSKNT